MIYSPTKIVKCWILQRTFKYSYMDEFVIQVDFMNGERMLLDIPEIITDIEQINDRYVELRLKDAFKRERIDKLKSILYEEC